MENNQQNTNRPSGNGGPAGEETFQFYSASSYHPIYFARCSDAEQSKRIHIIR